MSVIPRPLRVLIVEDNPVIRDLFMVAVKRLRNAYEAPQTSLNQALDDMEADKAAVGQRHHEPPQSAEDALPVEVHEAADGSSALDKILEIEFDLVVTDLYLPVLNGIELIRRVRANPLRAATPILAMSASIRDARDLSLGAGADRFLAKPLRLVELLEALRSLLKIPHT